MTSLSINSRKIFICFLALSIIASVQVEAAKGKKKQQTTAHPSTTAAPGAASTTPAAGGATSTTPKAGANGSTTTTTHKPGDGKSTTTAKAGAGGSTTTAKAGTGGSTTTAKPGDGKSTTTAKAGTTTTGAPAEPSTTPDPGQKDAAELQRLMDQQKEEHKIIAEARQKLNAWKDWVRKHNNRTLNKITIAGMSHEYCKLINELLAVGHASPSTMKRKSATTYDRMYDNGNSLRGNLISYQGLHGIEV